MKLLPIILLLLTTVECYSQNLNEKLYQAVKDNDISSVETLLKKGADPNYKRKLGSFEMSMLITAVQSKNLEIVKLLVENKAEVDFRDVFNSTAIMYAAHKGSIEIVSFLYNSGADIHAEDGQGNTVLTAAKEGGNPEVISLVEALMKK